MKRLITAIMVIVFAQLTLFAQISEDFSMQLIELKRNISEASTDKQIKDTSRLLDAFLSHVHIGRPDNVSHNIKPFLSSRYENKSH